MNRLRCYGGPYDGQTVEAWVVDGKAELPDPNAEHPGVVPPSSPIPPPGPYPTITYLEVTFAYGMSYTEEERAMGYRDPSVTVLVCEDDPPPDIAARIERKHFRQYRRH